MKRVLIYTVSGLLLAGTWFGALSIAGESAPGQRVYEGLAPQMQYVQYEGQDADAQARDFEIEMEKARAQQDPNELGRRQYIPQYMEGSSGTILGTVTLVGDDNIRMVESGTGIVHEILVSDAQEAVLTTGFNISAEVSNGRLVSFVEQGVPPDVEKIVYSAEDLPTDNILEQQNAF
ncbi:MAG TPA: hypothetical protein VLG45_07955 [Thermodesulfobacteriota bacterium]|nr:hypothetical protein [Thermodesulfobacteriota bacterium]